jgi:acyl-CoA synthetase (AMP-forming)/AMP-acid ligase II
MTRWKCPSYIEILENLPVTATGKVLKRQLQEKDLKRLEQGRNVIG